MFVFGDTVAELIIICQTIRKRLKTASRRQRAAPDENRRTEREVQRLEHLRLQHLAPKIRVHGHRLPAHRGRDGIGEPVKTIHQPRLLIEQRRDKVRQKIRRHAHIGIADADQIMRR